MIDSHCHLLPGLDDGARSLHESVQMARRLAVAGVETVICTPHYSSRHPTGLDQARRALASVASALDELSIPLRIELAAELAPDTAIRRPVEELHARTIGPRHLLVELQPRTTGSAIGQILDRVLDQELVPILAHPERCEAVQRDPNLVTEARSAGALIQIVAPSLVGRGSALVGRTAWSIIGRGDADLLGSDAHRADSRGLQLNGIVEMITSREGRQAADRLTRAAGAILGGAASAGGG